jgi:hypothetical protein
VVSNAVDVGAPLQYWLFGDRNRQLPVVDLAFQRYLTCKALADSRSRTSSRHGMHSPVSSKNQAVDRITDGQALTSIPWASKKRVCYPYDRFVARQSADRVVRRPS